MKLLRWAAVVVLASLSGCSGCSDGDTKTPDAFVIHDMGIDARNCGSVSWGTLDVIATSASRLRFGGPVTGELGDGFALNYLVELYDGIEPSLAGTFDLHAGNQANYSSCAVCVLALAEDANGDVAKVYFQSAGSVTLTEDPFTNQRIVGSITGLQLEEVTIDQQSAASTPVPGGKCASLPDNNVDHDRVPNAWTCAHADYDTATNCNCMCGTPDPDCLSDTAAVMGCTTGQACFNDACVAAPANDTCALATPLVIGTPVNGSTAGAKHNYDMGLETTGCTGYEQPGPDVVYSVALTANQAITVTLSNLAATYDGSIALVGPGAATICDATTIACVAGKDNGLDGANETFSYTATTAGTYFIIVDSWAPDVGGTFTLNVTSP